VHHVRQVQTHGVWATYFEDDNTKELGKRGIGHDSAMTELRVAPAHFLRVGRGDSSLRTVCAVSPRALVRMAMVV
jgi:hypothetical protein